MANYKYDKFFTKRDHQAFDQVHSPGTIAPHSGIYGVRVVETISSPTTAIPCHHKTIISTPQAKAAFAGA